MRLESDLNYRTLIYEATTLPVDTPKIILFFSSNSFIGFTLIIFREQMKDKT